MTWKDVGSAVASAAPVLGSVLGGPVGLLVGAGGSLVASALGVEPKPDAVMAAVQNNPDALVRLRDIEARELSTLLQWQTEQLKAEVDDRKSARTASVDGGDRNKMFYLTLFLFVVAFGLEAAVVFFGVAAGTSGELVGRILGTADTLCVMVGSFWFGSARSSQDKDMMLYHSTPAKETFHG